MSHNKLLISDDIKSTFADLLGRKPRNVSNIKIEGKHISLHPNPKDNDKQYPLETDNSDFKTTDIEIISSPDQPESLTSSELSTPNNTNNTPTRGSVLASYIHRFRNAPAINPYQRNQNDDTDFWWIKNGMDNTNINMKNRNVNQYTQQRPNSAPTTITTSNQEYEYNNDDNKQLTIVNNQTQNSIQSSLNSSLSDNSELLNSIKQTKPKAIQYKNDNISIHSSIDNSSDITDMKEQEINIIHTQSQSYINDNYNDNTPIDVDDILEKWRKKRRLKQLATENGMNTQSISNLLNSNNSNSDFEIHRIKQRLGLLSDNQTHSIPSQPFTATIHPISTSLSYQPTYTNNNHYCNQSNIRNEHVNEYPTTPIRNGDDHKEQEKTPHLSTQQYRNDRSNNFLADQQLLREQQAKVERLARIQRRMCCNEKRILDQTKNINSQKSFPSGRQRKTSSPFLKRTHCRIQEIDKVQRKLDFEYQENDEIDYEFEEKDETSDDSITQFLTKSVQTMPNILTPKISKIESQRLKNNITTIEETKRICFSLNPTEILPKDIMDKLNKLYQNGELKNENDFDKYFRKILNSHRNKKEIAIELLKFMNMQQNNECKNDECNDLKLTLKSSKLPLPSSSENQHESDTDKLDDKSDHISENENENSEEKQQELNDKLLVEENENDQNSSISDLPQSLDSLDIGYNEETTHIINEKNENKQEQKLENDNTLCKQNETTESGIIIEWIKQNPDYYFEPATQNDIEVIQNFVDGPIANINCHSSLINVNENQNEFVYNDYQNTYNEIISLNDDTEILTLIKSCKTLRNDISIL